VDYKKTKPHQGLEPFIHFYWELKGNPLGRQRERVFPDGCAGIIMNLGDQCLTDNGSVAMVFGKTYVVGAMSSYKDSFFGSDTHLLGVCFKPAGFTNFYKYEPQQVLINDTIEFEKSSSFELDKVIRDPIDYFNRFYSDKIINKTNPLQGVIDDIYATRGQIGISDLSKRNFTTVRQLEREFRKHMGFTPREYSNIIRFQHALNIIRNSAKNRSLSSIAFECGYYDHAHLSNEIKRKTGMKPSEI